MIQREARKFAPLLFYACPAVALHQVFLHEPALVKIVVTHLDSSKVFAVVVVNIDRDIV